MGFFAREEGLFRQPPAAPPAFTLSLLAQGLSAQLRAAALQQAADGGSGLQAARWRMSPKKYLQG